MTLSQSDQTKLDSIKVQLHEAFRDVVLAQPIASMAPDPDGAIYLESETQLRQILTVMDDISLQANLADVLSEMWSGDTTAGIDSVILTLDGFIQEPGRFITYTYEQAEAIYEWLLFADSINDVQVDIYLYEAIEFWRSRKAVHNVGVNREVADRKAKRRRRHR